ncbi:centrin-binding protein sfi1 [Colletotrichum tofieldiae]|nr:centrin-binding protein sfi1 [Colletotrichum tofieldiae]
MCLAFLAYDTSTPTLDFALSDATAVATASPATIPATTKHITAILLCSQLGSSSHAVAAASPSAGPRDGVSSFVSVQSSDSYYSDEGESRTPSEGERLATNALFQAYDAVLPLYGVDPEEDHHISRLVFRIGGERGDGSLLEKLRAVLSRMGIGLEFDSRSDGSKAFSDHGDGSNYHGGPGYYNGPGYEYSFQQSPALTATDHNSGSSEDEPSQEEHPVLRPAQQEELASLPDSQPYEAYHLDDSASPQG